MKKDKYQELKKRDDRHLFVNKLLVSRDATRSVTPQEIMSLKRVMLLGHRGPLIPN